MQVQCTCLRCGIEFPSTTGRIRDGRGRYCSHYCADHSRRRIPPAERFLAMVQRGGPDNCWPFTGYIHQKDGVGRFTERDGISPVTAPSYAWRLANGDIPEGMQVCHSCDVRYPAGDSSYRRCCNPAHLWLGTAAENMADMAVKGRSAQGSRQGCAKLTEASVSQMLVDFANGTKPMELARRYSVSAPTVTGIIHGYRWRHVPRP